MAWPDAAVIAVNEIGMLQQPHEVSIQTGSAVGRHFGFEPRAKISMTIMRPPQHGHRRCGAPVSFGSASVAPVLMGTAITRVKHRCMRYRLIDARRFGSLVEQARQLTRGRCRPCRPFSRLLRCDGGTAFGL